jgi:hypothetical protein
MNEETTNLSENSISIVADILQRPPSYCDDRGYQNDLLGAAIHPQRNRIAYVESRMKKRWWSAMWNASIKIHLWAQSGSDRSVDIRSYNPFFGCDVEYFEWMDDDVLLIYSEKHNTYACSFGSTWPPRFVQIEPSWKLESKVLTYIDSEHNVLGRLSLPDLKLL